MVVPKFIPKWRKWKWSHSVVSWLFATPWTVAYQAPPAMGFSRQEYWSGLPFPSPMHESQKWKSVTQSCPTLSDPMDCSPPGSSSHGIFQARVLEWGAIAFSNTDTLLLVIFKHVLPAEIISQITCNNLKCIPFWTLPFLMYKLKCLLHFAKCQFSKNVSVYFCTCSVVKV